MRRWLALALCLATAPAPLRAQPGAPAPQPEAPRQPPQPQPAPAEQQRQPQPAPAEPPRRQPPQPAPAEPQQPPQPAPAAQPRRQPAPAAQPAPGDRYDRAFAALVAGRLADAIAGFDEVAARAADPDRRAAARELARLTRTLRDRQLTVATAGAPAPRAVTVAAINEDDRPSAGRVELVTGSTLAGFYAGFALGAVLDIDDFRAGAVLVTATTGAAFTASLLASRDARITNGSAGSYNLGLLLGASNGLLLASPVGVEDGDGILSLGLGGLALGGAAGLLVGRASEPTPAQVGFTGTMAILGIATSGLGLGIVQPDAADGDALLLTLAAGLDVGAAVGAGIAPRLRWSNARANLTGLSAFLGAVGGFGIAAIVAGAPDGDGEVRAFSAATLAGMWGGFAIGAAATRDMAPHPRFSGDRLAAPIAIAPARIGHGYGLSIAGGF